MQLDWAIHASLIQKRISHSYQSKHYMWLCDFVAQDYYNVTVVLHCVSVNWFGITIPAEWVT